MIVQMTRVALGQHMLIRALGADAALMHQFAAVVETLRAKNTIWVFVSSRKIREWKANAHFESGSRGNGHGSDDG